MSSDASNLRRQILERVRRYAEAAFPSVPFRPGRTPIPVGGRVFDAEEVTHLVDASLDFWLTTGRFAARFEREFARIMDVKHVSLVNSGSSANLLALASLTSPTLGPRQLRSGDEVITVASGFPTTVNPIIQNRLVPVFVDVSLPTYNVNVAELEEAVSDRTRAIILAHTLGNPFNLDAVTAFARKHGLWLIEDCCDAIGSVYRDRPVGSWGDLATVSFYPAHHITMGEGGAVLTNRDDLRILVESFRDWGRDCHCAPGRDNTCGKRFQMQFGDLPFGYDHKYVYTHIGYNLKLTDMQAAVGVAQLAKLPRFIEARRRNFRTLYEHLRELEDIFILPEATAGSAPSWFGFPLSIRDGARTDRSDLLRHLNDRKIATRLLFGGNLVRQPAYHDVPHRVVGDLAVADSVMARTFWVGVYPALTEEMLAYVAASIRELCRGR